MKKHRVERGGYQVIVHRGFSEWYVGWGRFRNSLSVIYEWWVQVGPLEVRKWK